jgi:hypothetical protein
MRLLIAVSTEYAPIDHSRLCLNTQVLIKIANVECIVEKLQTFAVSKGTDKTKSPGMKNYLLKTK